MPRGAQTKDYKVFSNGFITEATPLAFPENSCQDILNCDIELKGSVRRRLGLNEEAGGFTIGNGFVASQTYLAGVNGGHYSNVLAATTVVGVESLAMTTHIWPNPGGIDGLYFVVFQIGNLLSIRNWDATAVSDPNALVGITTTTSLRIDNPAGFTNSGFVYKTTPDVCSQQPLQSSPGFGRLWFTSQAVFPFYLEYDGTTKLISAHANGWDSDTGSYPNGRLDIRDFNGVPDGLQPNQWQAVLTQEHEYNLVNQGWDIPTPIAGNIGTVQYYHDHSDTGQYPPNSMQWFLGRDATLSDDGFNPKILDGFAFGNSFAARGAVIMNALIGSKDNIPTQSPTFPVINFHGKYDEPSATGFTTCAFYAGRIFYAGDSNLKRPNGVYFSKTMLQPSDSGVFMQLGDPTSQNNSDLLATDGGVIYITEADHIMKLQSFGAGLLVFAHNGVWLLTGDGTGGGFTASSYSVQKVSDTGIIGPNCVAATDQALFFFSENSVCAVTLPQQGVIPIVTDIGRTRIFTFYNDIYRLARLNARAVFDTISKKLFWFYLNLPLADYNYPNFQTAYNAALILDTRTGAFTKYSFKTTQVNGPTLFTIVGGFPNRYPVIPLGIDLVFRGSDEVLVTDLEDIVVFDQPGQNEEFINNIRVVIADGSASGGALQICEFEDLTFQDFATMGTANANFYESYLVTAPETIGDLQRIKAATYCHSFFLRTETGFAEDLNSVLTPIRPSGCTVQGQWDWQNTATGKRWSKPQAAYRYLRRHVPVDASDTYDTGQGVLYTKVKIRGEGRALTVKYDSVPGMDFQLQGFSVAFTANAV